MTMQEVCDEVLRYCVQNNNRLDKDIAHNDFSNKGISYVEFVGALSALSDNQPAYLTIRGAYHVLTPEGEKFIRIGGYAHIREQEEIERLSKEEDRRFSKLVSQSVLDTNKSVQETHSFQKRITITMLIITTLALVVSVIGLLRNSDKSQIQPLLQQQIQLQRQIDSLQYLLRARPTSDTLFTKGQ
jgi:hypothetical protein